MAWHGIVSHLGSGPGSSMTATRSANTSNDQRPPHLLALALLVYKYSESEPLLMTCSRRSSSSIYRTRSKAPACHAVLKAWKSNIFNHEVPTVLIRCHRLLTINAARQLFTSHSTVLLFSSSASEFSINIHSF